MMQTEMKSSKSTGKSGKKGLFSRLRRRKGASTASPHVVTPDKRESTPSPVQQVSTRESVPEGPLPSALSSKSADSSVPSIQNKKSHESKRVTLANPQSIPIGIGSHKMPTRETVTLKRAPTAKEAAFNGPPRYDWIDIETAAAIKVQSNFRRCKVMTDLEKQGLSTAAIRNRSRRRETKHEMAGSEDIPSLLACCGVGLAFGDATEEDNDARRAYQKELYEQRKKEREEKEEKLRNQFRSKKMANKRQNDVEESYEVVD